VEQIKVNLTNLVAKSVFNYQNTNSISFKLRAKRIAPLKDMIAEASQKYGHVKIIDVGGNKWYWNIISEKILQEKNVKITIINLPGMNSFQDDEIFNFLEGDGCNLSNFDNDSFHIAHSNSVVEHVGNWDNMLKFASEIKRVSKGYFVQTPYFWFPMEPHFMIPFFHWLPEPVRVSMVMKFDLARRKKKKDINSAVQSIEHVHLIDKKMFGELFKDAQINFEKVFFIPKSMIAVKCI
jgi:hypothetical protein